MGIENLKNPWAPNFGRNTFKIGTIGTLTAKAVKEAIHRKIWRRSLNSVVNDICKSAVHKDSQLNYRRNKETGDDLAPDIRRCGKSSGEKRKNHQKTTIVREDPHNDRSQIGYLFTYGGTTISWSSVKQKIVATSFNHAELLALHESMAGKNDAAIVAALEAVTQAMQNHPNAGVMGESRSLSMFQREKSPTFRGRYDLDGEQEWLKEIERIFRVMDCFAAHKVGTRQRLGAIGEVITWVVFTREFLRKYFPEDVRRKKEMEFLALKQKNSNVTEYTGKFLELMNFYPHYSAETAEFLKCIKFESGLRLEIKWVIGYQQICRFAELVNSCQINEEDNIAHSAHYKSVNEKRGKLHHDCRKPYDSLTEKGKQKVSDWKTTSGGGAFAPVKCYRYGEQGHHFNECENKVLRCYKCGKTIHHAPDCKDDDPTCFNYGEQGHIST
ncbi:uncharacterized protein LOC131630660 [Vicia villosa]|uniref:uncharacterized protein LOC131630660 n=1 Tax=Vicia villosa TaxID=3911 RepID=UPI00273BBFFD|nr:uncharacterized protein LOC131630660 [Vicia villosa]